MLIFLGMIQRQQNQAGNPDYGLDGYVKVKPNQSVYDLLS